MAGHGIMMKRGVARKGHGLDGIDGIDGNDGDNLEQRQQRRRLAVGLTAEMVMEMMGYSRGTPSIVPTGADKKYLAHTLCARGPFLVSARTYLKSTNSTSFRGRGGYSVP